MAIQHSREKRGLVFYKTDGHCGYCGRKLDPFENWHVEHMVPQAKNGSNELNNLISSCDNCNVRKRNRTIEEFRDWILGSIAADLRKKWLPRLEYAKAIVGQERIEALIEDTEDLIRKLENEPIQFYIDDSDLT